MSSFRSLALCSTSRLAPVLRRCRPCGGSGGIVNDTLDRLTGTGPTPRLICSRCQGQGFLRSLAFRRPRRTALDLASMASIALNSGPEALSRLDA